MSAITRTIEPGITVFSAAEIRVALLPVGQLPKDVLEDCLGLLNRHRHVSLSASRSYHRGDAPQKTTCFQYMDWNNGYMHFRFLLPDDSRRRTRIVDLHQHRQVLVVIGVVHCPTSPSLVAAHAEFLKLCRQFPDAFVYRCFAFEPSEKHLLEDLYHLQDMVVFPPGGQKHLDQHLEVWMHDLVALVLTEIEKWMTRASPGNVKLNTYTDSSEFTGQSVVLEEVQKRLAISDDEVKENKRWGRLLKAKGDLCLMAGSPQDAHEHYMACIEAARSTNDLVWYASALEGLAQVRVMQALSAPALGSLGTSSSHGNLSTALSGVPQTLAGLGGGGGALEGVHSMRTSSASSRRGGEAGTSGRAGWTGFGCKPMWDLLRRGAGNLEAEVRERFGEARALYKRKGGVTALQVEQQLKLCRLLAGLRGATSAAKEVLEMCTAVSEQLPALHLLEDRVIAMVEVAQVSGLVGCHRRRLLLLWSAMELARAVDKNDVLRIALRALEPPDDAQQQDPDDVARVHWSARRLLAGPQRPWTGVWVPALEAAFAAAKQAGSSAEAWETAAVLVRNHYSGMTPQIQAAMLDAIAQASAALPPHLRMRPGSGPGPFPQIIRLLLPAPSLQAVRLQLSGAAARAKNKQGPFIFNPYAAKREQAAGEAEAGVVEWVTGEEARVQLYLANPLAVQLRLEKVQLFVTHTPLPGYNSQRSSMTGAASQQDVGGTGGGTAGGENASSTSRGAGLTSPSGSSSNSALPSAFAHGLAKSTSTANFAALSSNGMLGASGAGAATALPWKGREVTNVVLPPHGRPVRLVLVGQPLAPGLVTLQGVQVTMWGATWQQPFGRYLQRAPGSGAARGDGAAGPNKPGGRSRVKARPLRPTEVLTPVVSVLPALPLLRANLKGGDISVVTPSDQDICWSDATGTGQAGATPLTDPLAGTATSVPVFEGQRMAWTLTLTNSGPLPVMACQVVVVNSKSVVLKPLPQDHLSASFVGAHVQVDEGALDAALPLACDTSIDLTVSVQVGRSTGATFEDTGLELRISYGGAPPADTSGDPDTLLGRRMTIPFNFVIQRALQVTPVNFLERLVPVRDGFRQEHLAHVVTPAGAQRQASSSHRADFRWGANPALRSSMTQAGRHHSDGALFPMSTRLAGLDLSVPVASAGSASTVLNNRSILLSAKSLSCESDSPASRSRQLSPLHHGSGGGGGDSMAAASSATSPPGLFPGSSRNSFTGHMPSSSHPSGVTGLMGGGTEGSSRPSLHQMSNLSRSGGRVSESAGHDYGGGCSTSARLVSFMTDCILEVHVTNNSERYFRACLRHLPTGMPPDFMPWMPDDASVEVIQPGGSVTLFAEVIPPTPGGGGTLSASFRSPRVSGGGFNTLVGDDATPFASSSHRFTDEAERGSDGWRTDPDRLACAESLAEEWAVCWEMITGEGPAAAGRAPHGMARLPTIDVARSLTFAALSVLQPSALHLSLAAINSDPAHVTTFWGTAGGDAAAASSPRISAPGAAAAAAAATAAVAAANGVQVTDVTAAALEMGVRLGPLVGPLWAISVQLGETLEFELHVCNRGSSACTLRLSLACCSAELAGQQQQQGNAWNAEASTNAADHPSAPSQQRGGYRTGGSSHSAGGFRSLSIASEAAAASSAVAGAAAAAAADVMMVDSGVILTGAYQGVVVTAEPTTGLPALPDIEDEETAGAGHERDVDAGAADRSAFDASGPAAAAAGGSSGVQRFAAIFVRPGLYQLGVHDVCAMVDVAVSAAAVEGSSGPPSRSLSRSPSHSATPRPFPALPPASPNLRRMYATCDHINVMCVAPESGWAC